MFLFFLNSLHLAFVLFLKGLLLNAAVLIDKFGRFGAAEVQGVICKLGFPHMLQFKKLTYELRIWTKKSWQLLM